ncbi:MAG TPA: GNAT family N-acetyltransferase [Ilumatobacteraceae bacterium]|nr:GNAT family N-acetyltransferase [Ilumatobacteraceae bacterium]
MDRTVRLDRVEIETITGRADLAPLLARWHAAEWAHLYDPSVWNEQIAVEEFVAQAAPGSDDVTWIAFDGPGRGHGDVVGSVSLLDSDDLTGYEHLSPWLASLYVRPDWRGVGIARRLIDTLIEAARVRGDQRVHLFTSGQEGYYLDRGWHIVGGSGVKTVMTIETDAI